MTELAPGRLPVFSAWDVRSSRAQTLHLEGLAPRQTGAPSVPQGLLGPTTIV